MAGTSVLAGAHRHDLGLGLLEAAWLALAASILTYRHRARIGKAPGQVDRVQIALAATGTTVAAGLTLLPLLGG